MIHDIVIVGAGPAGLTAAIYAGRAMLKPIVIYKELSDEGEVLGQLTVSGDVENYPGFLTIKGDKLIENMKQQCIKLGVVFVNATIKNANFDNKIKQLLLDYESEEKMIQSRSVIIATGARARWLPVTGDPFFRLKGVYTCTECDGYFYRKKNVVVVGGGDSAMESAIYLSKIANKVTLLNRSSKFRASAILLNRVRNLKNVKILTNSKVIEYIGGKKLKRIKIQNNERTYLFDTDAVFLSIGHIPNTGFLPKEMLDSNGFIIGERNVFTKKKGIFACGDVVDQEYRQAITAAGLGCMAAIEATRFVS